MVEFKIYSKLKTFFSRFNPINSFDWGDEDVVIDNAPSSDELLVRAIENHNDFEKIILVALYHLINTQCVEDEYLTVLTKDLKLISDLVKGKEGRVEIPQKLKEEPSSNILLTCHNHFQKAILPSSNDLKNIFKPNIKFTIIVSDNHIGIIVNELGDKFFEFNEKELNLFKETWKGLSIFIMHCLNHEKPNEVLKFYLADEESDEMKNEFQKIYDEFVGKNIDKFVDEFNIRYKKYNIYYIHIEV